MINTAFFYDYATPKNFHGFYFCLFLFPWCSFLFFFFFFFNLSHFLFFLSLSSFLEPSLLFFSFSLCLYSFSRIFSFSSLLLQRDQNKTEPMCLSLFSVFITANSSCGRRFALHLIAGSDAPASAVERKHLFFFSGNGIAWPKGNSLAKPSSPYLFLRLKASTGTRQHLCIFLLLSARRQSGFSWLHLNASFTCSKTASASGQTPNRTFILSRLHTPLATICAASPAKCSTNQQGNFSIATLPPCQVSLLLHP